MLGGARICNTVVALQVNVVALDILLSYAGRFRAQQLRALAALNDTAVWLLGRWTSNEFQVLGIGVVPEHDASVQVDDVVGSVKEGHRGKTKPWSSCGCSRRTADAPCACT